MYIMYSFERHKMKNKFAECYCRHYIAQTENEIAATEKTLKQLQKRRKKYFDLLLKIEEHGDKYIYTFKSNYENGYEMPEMIAIPSISINDILKANELTEQWFRKNDNAS